jgi:hypothetical protein
MEIKLFDTLHLWSSKILTILCDFIDRVSTIFPYVEMLHNNTLETIEKV